MHDHGKNRERWQRTANGQVTPAGQDWLDATVGKSGGGMKRDPRGYRHEFGSLREFIETYSGKIDADVFDLAMHLIATHHGRGRPHFAKGGFDPDCEARTDEIHTECIRRFARLQRKYGWWRLAWLENLLRCADGTASSVDATADDGEPEIVQ
jgi:CRISPR-associated endonuclease/helicase Cas3